MTDTRSGISRRERTTGHSVCRPLRHPRRRLTPRGEAGSFRAVKLLLPLLALTLFATACSNQDARRRNLYSPAQPSGPYTRSLEDGSWRHKVKPADEDMRERREEEKIRQMQKTAPAA